MSRMHRFMPESRRRGRSWATLVLTVLLQLWPLSLAWADDCDKWLAGKNEGVPTDVIVDCAGTPSALPVLISLVSGGAGVLIATALGQVLQQAAQQGTRKGTRILSGAEAIKWLSRKDKGFIKDGYLTEKFNRWQRRSPGDETPDPDGLGAVAGEWDWGEKWGPTGQWVHGGWKDQAGNPVGEPELTIVVDDDDVEPPDVDEPPDETPPEPPPVQPPPKEEPPPEKEVPPWRPPPEEPPPSPDDACKNHVVNVERLDEVIWKIKGANVQLQNEVNVLRRQKTLDKGNVCACAAIDMFNWALSEALVITNPWSALAVSTVQAEVAAVIKTAIKLAFEGEASSDDFTFAAVKNAVSKGLSEGLKSLAKTRPELLQKILSDVPAAPGAPLDAFLKSAGRFGRMLLNPGFITNAFANSWLRQTEMNNLIEHKKSLISQNDSVLSDKWKERQLAEQDLVDCVSRATDALRRFAERKKETDAWIAAQRSRSRRST